MSVPARCELIGRWRIVEADLRDRGYLDLVAPAAIVIGADNRGEIAFGVIQASLDLSYSPSMVVVTWAGFHEMDEIPDTVRLQPTAWNGANSSEQGRALVAPSRHLESLLVGSLLRLSVEQPRVMHLAPAIRILLQLWAVDRRLAS